MYSPSFRPATKFGLSRELDLRDSSTRKLDDDGGDGLLLCADKRVSWDLVAHY